MVESQWQRWYDEPSLTEDERRALLGMTAEQREEAFSQRIAFGTAGLRGIMGPGTSRMNRFTVRHAASALSYVLNQKGKSISEKGICICFDCRNNSRFFAEEAAAVLNGAGIPVYFFREQRPTPELSFAVRHYGCAAGINITASHNPKEYNGLKVYGADGAQLAPAACAAIADRMLSTDILQRAPQLSKEEAAECGLLSILGEETDEAFLKCVLNVAEPCRNPASALKVVYTPLHGTGAFLIPEALHRIGIENVFCVEEQMVQDGEFSTVAYPNPENPESFSAAIIKAKTVNADMIIGSDPDADRLAMLYRVKNGEYCHMSGNLTAALLLNWYAGKLKEKGLLPEKPVVLKSLVTTELVRKVSESLGCLCEDTFTGFKYLAERKEYLEKNNIGHVIFSCEESYGTMVGEHCRDKDAVTASVLLCLMAEEYNSRGISVESAVHDLYTRFGYYREKTIGLTFDGADGIKKMGQIMCGLRENTPEIIAGIPVLSVRDYLTGMETSCPDHIKKEIEISGENVLRFLLSDGSVVVVRPSGTEPKLKIYLMVRGQDASEGENKLCLLRHWTDAFGI